MADEDLKEKLREIIAEVSEVDDIPDETPFADLGIDSMMAIEIVAEVERTYKISIPEEELQKLTHFTAVYETVRTHLEAAAAE
jgi:acyl carrier protein